MRNEKLRKAMGGAAVTAVLFVVSGCGSYSSYHREGPVIDASILRAGLSVGDSYSAMLQSPTFQGWREVFTEPRLVALIEEGLAHNSDLTIAKLHVDAAKSLLRQAKGEQLPSLGVVAEGGTARFKNSEAEADSESKFRVGAEASWEVDIFGKLKNAKSAAAAHVEEQTAYAQAVEVELISTIATSYYQLEMYDSQIRHTCDIVNSWDESVRVEKALLGVGEATIDEVNMAEASKLEASETLESLQQQMIHAEDALCVLLGRHSGHIARDDFDMSFAQMPQMPRVSIASLSSRPDIRQAEASLKRAFYLTNEARSALYPSLNLSGFIGWTNDADEVVSPAGLLTKALGSLTQPIFAKGRLRSAVRQAESEQESAKVSFRQAILKAGQEVNDVLASLQYTQRAIALSSQQVEKLTSVLESTEHRMRYSGDVNYLQVLLARQSLLHARLSLLSHRYGLLECSIQLYKALGGKF